MSWTKRTVDDGTTIEGWGLDAWGTSPWGSPTEGNWRKSVLSTSSWNEVSNETTSFTKRALA